MCTCFSIMKIQFCLTLDKYFTNNRYILKPWHYSTHLAEVVVSVLYRYPLLWLDDLYFFGADSVMKTKILVLKSDFENKSNGVYGMWNKHKGVQSILCCHKKPPKNWNKKNKLPKMAI